MLPLLEKRRRERINSLNFKLIASLIECNALNFYIQKKKKGTNTDKNREQLALGNNFKKLWSMTNPNTSIPFSSGQTEVMWQRSAKLAWIYTSKGSLEIKVGLLFSSDVSHDFKGCSFLIWVPQEVNPEARIPKWFICEAIPGNTAGEKWASEPRKGRSQHEEHYQASSIDRPLELDSAVEFWGPVCSTCLRVVPARVMELGCLYIHQLPSRGSQGLLRVGATFSLHGKAHG